MESSNRYDLSRASNSSVGSEAIVVSADIEPSSSSTPRSRLEKWSPRWLWELMGYGLVSVIALAADTLILRSLVKGTGWPYVPASIVSFIAGAVVAYLLSTRFVFGSHRLTNRVTEFGLFVALGVFGLAVNTVVLWLMHGIWGTELIASKMVAAVCTFMTNFMLRRGLLFSSTEKEYR